MNGKYKMVCKLIIVLFIILQTLTIFSSSHLQLVFILQNFQEHLFYRTAPVAASEFLHRMTTNLHSRGVFRNFPNIHDGSFYEELVAGFRH